MKVDIPKWGEGEPSVHIDKWDTWSLDYALAYILAPALKQLKETKQGAPFVNDSDVPTELAGGDNWEVDEKWFARWDYVLDEMIWACEWLVFREDEYEQSDDYEINGYFQLGKRAENGFVLLGKYFMNLWD